MPVARIALNFALAGRAIRARTQTATHSIFFQNDTLAQNPIGPAWQRPCFRIPAGKHESGSNLSHPRDVSGSVISDAGNGVYFVGDAASGIRTSEAWGNSRRSI